jgi:hypothetical protein
MQTLTLHNSQLNDSLCIYIPVDPVWAAPHNHGHVQSVGCQVVGHLPCI